MVNKQSDVEPVSTEWRSEYFLADEDGFYKASLFLTKAELFLYSGLLDKRPPERVEQSKAIEASDAEYMAHLWVLIRARRTKLLADSDWVVTRAMDLGLPMPSNWWAYRQALRNITLQPDPRFLVWPTPPV